MEDLNCLVKKIACHCNEKLLIFARRNELEDMSIFFLEIKDWTTLDGEVIVESCWMQGNNHNRYNPYAIMGKKDEEKTCVKKKKTQYIGTINIE